MIFRYKNYLVDLNKLVCPPILDEKHSCIIYFYYFSNQQSVFEWRFENKEEGMRVFERICQILGSRDLFTQAEIVRNKGRGG